MLGFSKLGSRPSFSTGCIAARSKYVGPLGLKSVLIQPLLFLCSEVHFHTEHNAQKITLYLQSPCRSNSQFVKQESIFLERLSTTDFDELNRLR